MSCEKIKDGHTFRSCWIFQTKAAELKPSKDSKKSEMKIEANIFEIVDMNYFLTIN